MKAMAIVAMAALAGITARAAKNVTVYLNHDLNTGGVMYQAQERAAKAFAEVGVRIEWRTGPPPATQPDREPAIVVRLAEHTPADYLPGALAFAKVYEGVHITVFWDRIESQFRLAPPVVVLAHVLVHEITQTARNQPAFREWCHEITVDRQRPTRDGKQTVSVYCPGCGTDSARPRITERHRSEGWREFGSEDHKGSRVRTSFRAVYRYQRGLSTSVVRSGRVPLQLTVGPRLASRWLWR